MPPARDYRWNLMRNQPNPVAPAAAPVSGNPPMNASSFAHVIGNLPTSNSPVMQRRVRPPTMGNHSTGQHVQRTTTFVDGRWVSREAEAHGLGLPRNTKHERRQVGASPSKLKKPKLEEGRALPSSFPPVEEEIVAPPIAPHPPMHGLIPVDRSQPLNTRGNERVVHTVLRIHEQEGGRQEREDLLPYTQIGADGVTTCRRRHRQLAPEANFTIMTRVSGNVRKRAECVAQREAARSLRMRLRCPTPGDPFDHTEGFSEDAIRLETMGCTYLELVDVMGNSASSQHIHRELLRRRGIRNNPHFMGHWREYRDAYADYRRQLRDFFPTTERRWPSVCAGFPHYRAHCREKIVFGMNDWRVSDNVEN